MTKKTLSKILLYGISIITVTMVLIVSVFYSYYEKQTENELEAIANIAQVQMKNNASYDFVNSFVDNETRITLIDSKGNVIADSLADSDKMENHLERPEVRLAIKNGSGYDVRKSETLGKNAHYYACMIDNGNILRVSTLSPSVAGVLSDIAVYIVLIFLLVVLVAVFVSFRITKSIVKPVEELGKNLDNIDNFETYAELKPFVNALKEQTEKQKRLNKQKKQFTANMSHELKTPLTSIAGYAELIETGIARREDIKPFAGTIRKQALRLVSLSEDIIQLSQLEENDDTGIAFSSVDIYAVAQKCVEALSINAKLKGISMTLDGKSTYIKANAALLEEMIYNLCDNAIRYNKENGSVNVTIVEDENTATICVKDTGIGIEKKYQERVFERFFRVDKSRSKATGGTGLGLAIVKHIAQSHGAELTVDSVLGEGTSISVYFNK